MMEKSERSWTTFTSGFTRMSVLAILYAIVVFIPATIYLTLMTGGVAGIPVAWFTLLLWVELGKLSGRRITKQEATMIMILTGAMTLYPLSLVYTAWYRTSPIAKSFDIGAYVPDWAAPSEETGIMKLRTFFNPAWVLPIGVTMATTLFFVMVNFGLGLFAREVFIETERLQFPMQQMSGTALMTLTGEEKRPLHILAVFAVIGFIYGYFLYAAPFILQAFYGRYVQIIPIPWVDLNRGIEKFFPGASLGVFTDLGPIASGFILGFPTVLGIFIGSFAIWFFGNWLTFQYNLVDIDPINPGVQSWWAPGMSIQMAWQRSLLYVWAMILIGTLLAVGLAPILRRPWLLRRAFSYMLRPRRVKRLTDPIPFGKVTLPLLIVGMAGSITLFAYLVPEFVKVVPWIFILMVFTPFLITMIGGRMIGETGVDLPGNVFPYLTNLLYYESGYRGVDIWFAPNIMTSSGGGTLSWFKVAELTETRSDGLIKIYWLLLPVALLFGYLYVELFWRLAPIPSGRYPGIAIYWDISATMQSIWIRGGSFGLFRPPWILYSFIVGTGLYLALDLLHCPVSFIALGAGVSTITPVAVTMLIGGLVAKIFSWIMGKEWWEKHKMLIAAGLMVGEGLSITLSVAMALIINSIWVLRF